MKIKEILRQSRRDFTANFECEHCGDVVKKNGYDDHFFHNDVIPGWVCVKCGKKASDDYRPLQPKHPAEAVL